MEPEQLVPVPLARDSLPTPQFLSRALCSTVGMHSIG